MAAKGFRASFVIDHDSVGAPEKRRRNGLLTDPTNAVDDVAGDAALMARIGARNAAAFRVMVERYAVVVRRLAYRMLGHVDDAEDVTQETFLRLWQKAPQWRPGTTGVGAWLNRVAVNLCLDRLRRRRFTSGEEVPERPDDAQLADELIDSYRSRAAVAHCLMALPERHRAAIVLTYYEEISNIMAADILDMKLKAFESLLYRARQALRDGLVKAGTLGPLDGDGA